MSDIAVTWAKAQRCVDPQGGLDRNAKQALVHLASYADANGEGWAAIWVLALEMDVSERSVQRGLQALKEAGLIIPVGRFHLHEGKRYPVYRLPLDQGFANTSIRIKAEREARKQRRQGGAETACPATGVTPGAFTPPPVSPQDGAKGVVCPATGVTPSAFPPPPVSPQDDTGVTPSPATGVTQIGKLNTQGLKPSARARVREACSAWAGKAPERVAPRAVEAAWLRAVERSGLSEEILLAGVVAAVRSDPDFERGKAMNLDRWLNEGRYEAWISEGATEPGPTPAASEAGWAGPAAVARVVASAMGPSAVQAYLARAGWDEDRRVILAATSIAAERLGDQAGALLKSIGVTVAARGAAHV